MDTKTIIALLLSSAAIGAVVSAAITAIAQSRELKRERVARQKELIFKVSVELSKAYLERVAKASSALVSVPEVTVLDTMHRIVTEVFEHGSLSKDSKEDLAIVAEMFSR